MFDKRFDGLVITIENFLHTIKAENLMVTVFGEMDIIL